MKRPCTDRPGWLPPLTTARALSLSDQLPASAIVLPGNEQPVDQSKGGIFRLPRRLEDSSTSRLGEGGTSKYLRKGATTSP